MRSLSRRVESLENAADPSHGLKPWQDQNWKPWHQIIQDADQTEEEAIASYEAEKGPLGDDACFVVRIIV